MGVARVEGISLIEADFGKQRLGPLARLPARERAMRAQCLGDLSADALERMKGGERLLKDHADPRSAQLLQLSLARLQKIAAFKLDPPAHASLAWVKQRGEGKRKGALACARLAHQAERPARAQL